MIFVEGLAWFFILGVFLAFGYCVYNSIWYKRRMDEERAVHREEIARLREEHRADTKDLWNRIMAGSYSEYESYKPEHQPKKPKASDNFIKRSIDQAEQNYIRERQGEG